MQLKPSLNHTPFENFLKIERNGICYLQMECEDF